MSDNQQGVFPKREDIHDLFSKVREHPDFIGGTIFVRADIPEGRQLPSGWREKWLTDRLAERGNQLLEQLTEQS